MSDIHAKIIAITFIVILVLNFILKIFNMLSNTIFWLIIILGALVAYFGIEKIKEF
jgi:uncharacterized RDD family membrane protein YckC